jgi:hypothetical protein
MRELPGPEQQSLRKEHRNDILTVPFALLAQITLFLMPMQILVKTYGTFWRTLPLFLVGFLGLYFFWWRVLPPAESGQVTDSQDSPEAAVANPVELDRVG